MEIVVHLVLVYLAVLVINMGLAGVLWFQNRTPQHRDLFLTWAGFAASTLLQGITNGGDPSWIALVFGTSILGNLPAARVLANAVGGRLPTRHLGMVWIASMGVSALLAFAGARFWLVALPVAVGSLAPIAVAVVSGLRYHRAALSPAGKLLYGAGVALALHQLDFPFLRMREDMAVWGFTIGLLVVTAMAISAPAVLLEKSTAERILLEEQGRMQRSFFANVSHELRTPLTLILSPLENLLTDKTLDLPPQVRGYLGAMQRSTNRLLRLINNLLDLAKVDAGKVFLRYEPIDLSAFIGGVLPAFDPMAQNKHIKLTRDLPEVERVYVDAERLDIVLQNLLANALKFTESGGTVSVRLGQTSRHVWIEVQDTGIGIAEKDLRVIFDRFGQADASVTRRFGGSGIGLALVKELAELHGGDVTVKSVLGVGSTFRVAIPRGTAHIREDLQDRRAVELEVQDDRRVPRVHGLATPPPQLEAALAEAPRAVSAAELQHAPRILLVEDNPELRAFLTDLLGRQYRVSIAVDGQEGVEQALELLPDLVLSDVMMPRLSGYDLTRAIKADPRTRAIPVILLTAKRGVDPALEGFEHGADDYLGKPFSTRELLARIKVQIDLRALARQVSEAQKTAMMSSLAAGLAHEVRNPINAIVNGLPALRYFLPEPAEGAPEGPAEALLRVLEDSARRIDTMIVELLDFTNLDRAAFNPWDPNEGVRSTLKLLGHRNSNGAVRVLTDFRFVGTVLGRPGPLNQVLMNLLDNAFKAVPDGGDVAVATRGLDGGLEVTVRDTGAGISPAVLPRIFDPFFTTRAVGVGTGLGLHLCKQIIQAHGGRLDAASTQGLGSGATFRVWLPSVAPERVV